MYGPSYTCTPDFPVRRVHMHSLRDIYNQVKVILRPVGIQFIGCWKCNTQRSRHHLKKVWHVYSTASPQRNSRNCVATFPSVPWKEFLEKPSTLKMLKLTDQLVVARLDEHMAYHVLMRLVSTLYKIVQYRCPLYIPFGWHWTWKKTPKSTSTELNPDSVLELLTKQFHNFDETKKAQVLKKLIEIVNPGSTFIIEP